MQYRGVGWLAGLICAVLAWPVAGAKFYRCELPDGRVEYRDHQCPMTAVTDAAGADVGEATASLPEPEPEPAVAAPPPEPAAERDPVLIEAAARYRGASERAETASGHPLIAAERMLLTRAIAVSLETCPGNSVQRALRYYKDAEEALDSAVEAAKGTPADAPLGVTADWLVKSALAMKDAGDTYMGCVAQTRAQPGTPAPAEPTASTP